MIQRGGVHIPGRHAGATDQSSDHRFALGLQAHRDGHIRLSLDLQIHPAGHRFVAQIGDDRFYLRLPALHRKDGRDMQLLHIGIAQLLRCDGAGDAAVGIVIVGHMEGAVLAEAVVHLHAQGMLAEGHMTGDSFKGSERVVVLRQQHIIQVYLRPETHAAEDEANIPLADDLLLVHRAAAIIVQRRDRLPCAGDEGLHGHGQSTGVKGGQRPQRRQFDLRTGMGGPEESLHMHFLPLLVI